MSRNNEIICPECKNTGWIECPDNTVRNCPACLERRRIEKIHRAIPPKFQDCTFENFRTETPAQKAAKDEMLSSKFGSYFIHGAYGSGKTHLLYSQYRQVFPSYGDDHAFVRTTKELIQEIQSEEVEGKKSPILDALYGRRTGSPNLFLFWDDADKFKVTDYKQEILFELVDGIYRNEQSLTVTSNFDLADLQNKLSPAIIRRIDDMCRVIEI